MAPHLEQRKLSETSPAPWRNFSLFPRHPERIAAARESFRATGGVWPGAIHLAVTKDGGRMRVFGEHRAAAAQEEYGADAKLVFLTDPSLTPEQALKRFCRENTASEETNLVRAIEVNWGVLWACGLGLIDLAPQKGKGPDHHRNAPSACGTNVPQDCPHPYNVKTLSAFSGLSEYVTKTALGVLEAVENGETTLEQFQSLTVSQGRAALTEIHAARKFLDTLAQQEEDAALVAAKKGDTLMESAHKKAAQDHKVAAKKVASAVAKEVTFHLKSGGAMKDVASVAAKVAPEVKKTTKAKLPPEFGKFVKSLAERISADTLEIHPRLKDVMLVANEVRDTYPIPLDQLLAAVEDAADTYTKAISGLSQKQKAPEVDVTPAKKKLKSK